MTVRRRAERPEKGYLLLHRVPNIGFPTHHFCAVSPLTAKTQSTTFPRLFTSITQPHGWDSIRCGQGQRDLAQLPPPKEKNT